MTKKGFNLMEILIVVAILGMVTCIGVMVLNVTSKKTRVQGTSDGLATMAYSLEQSLIRTHGFHREDFSDASLINITDYLNEYLSSPYKLGHTTVKMYGGRKYLEATNDYSTALKSTVYIRILADKYVDWEGIDVSNLSDADKPSASVRMMLVTSITDTPPKYILTKDNMAILIEYDLVKGQCYEGFYNCNTKEGYSILYDSSKGVYKIDR